MTKAQDKSLESEFDDFDQESTGGELFKFDTVGQKLTGLLVEKKPGKTKLGEAMFYTIQTKDSEHTFVPTKALGDDLSKYLRMYGGVGKVIVSIEFIEEKKGNYASPFKVFKVRAGSATEARLSAMGISTFDSESTNEESNGEEI
jgi:hypothetical protein